MIVGYSSLSADMDMQSGNFKPAYQMQTRQLINYDVIESQLVVCKEDEHKFQQFVEYCLKLYGLWPRQLPMLNKAEIPFLRLFLAVEHLGGVQELRYWKDVARLIGFSESVTNISFLIKNKYFTLINPILPMIKKRFVITNQIEQQSSSSQLNTELQPMSSNNFTFTFEESLYQPSAKLFTHKVQNLQLQRLQLEYVDITNSMFAQIFAVYPNLKHVCLCWLELVDFLPPKIISKLDQATLYGLSLSIKDDLQALIMKDSGVYQFYDREHNQKQTKEQKEALTLTLSTDANSLQFEGTQLFGESNLSSDTLFL